MHAVIEKRDGKRNMFHCLFEDIPCAKQKFASAAGKIIFRECAHRFLLAVRTFPPEKVIEPVCVGAEHVAEVPAPHIADVGMFSVPVRFPVDAVHQRQVDDGRKLMRRAELKFRHAAHAEFPCDFKHAEAEFGRP